MIASSYTFLDSIWTIIVFFIWVMWFMLLFRIWGDIFNRSDLTGLGKTGWLLFTILLPFLGVFIYVITQNDGMNERALDRARAQQSQMADHIRATAGIKQSCSRHREGQATPRQWRDQPERVRRPQAEGPRLVTSCSGVHDAGIEPAISTLQRRPIQMTRSHSTYRVGLDKGFTSPGRFYALCVVRPCHSLNAV